MRQQNQQMDAYKELNTKKKKKIALEISQMQTRKDSGDLSQRLLSSTILSQHFDTYRSVACAIK